MISNNNGLQAGYATSAVNAAVQNLVGEFDQRSNKRPLVRFIGTEDEINATCDAVWDALEGALNEYPNKYRVALMDSTDKLALYNVGSFSADAWSIEGADEEHAALRARADSCELQVPQAFRMMGHEDWHDLIDRVHVLVSK